MNLLAFSREVNIMKGFVLRLCNPLIQASAVTTKPRPTRVNASNVEFVFGQICEPGHIKNECACVVFFYLSTSNAVKNKPA